MQMVFQNPDSALNRSWTVRRILMRSVGKLTGVSGDAANSRVETLAGSTAAHPSPSRSQTEAAVRWSQTASRDRTRLRGRPPHRCVRRTNERTRRVGAGRHLEPARRSTGREEDQLRLHHPRHGRRAIPRRPDRGHVPRPHSRDRPDRRSVQRAAPSLHRSADVGRAKCRR